MSDPDFTVSSSGDCRDNRGAKTPCPPPLIPTFSPPPTRRHPTHPFDYPLCGRSIITSLAVAIAVGFPLLLAWNSASLLYETLTWWSCETTDAKVVSVVDKFSPRPKTHVSNRGPFGPPETQVDGWEDWTERHTCYRFPAKAAEFEYSGEHTAFIRGLTAGIGTALVRERPDIVAQQPTIRIQYLPEYPSIQRLAKPFSRNGNLVLAIGGLAISIGMLCGLLVWCYKGDMWIKVVKARWMAYRKNKGSKKRTGHATATSDFSEWLDSI